MEPKLDSVDRGDPLYTSSTYFREKALILLEILI